MSDILTDSKLAEIENANSGGAPISTARVVALIKSHRALIAERDKWERAAGRLKAENELLTEERDRLLHDDMEHEAMRLTIAEFEREVDAAWLAIHRGWDIEPRAYFEEQAPKNGFESPLAMAVHYMWKRKAKDHEAVEEFRRRAVRATLESRDKWISSAESESDHAAMSYAAAAGVLTKLIESLPLVEPEAEQLEGAIKHG